MGANALEIVALGNKVGFRCSLVNEGGNVGSYDMRAGLHEAQQGGSGTILSTDAGYLPRQCLDRAKPAWARSVMDGCTALPVPLVIHKEHDGVGK